MKAIVFTRYGRAEDLELREVPRPKPKADQVLVRVYASSVNSWDWEYLNGTPMVNRLMFGLTKPRPGKQRLGADIAGIVEDVGKDVTRVRPGDEVFGDLSESWGGFAEYACISETAVEAKPANLGFEEAASVPQAGVLAWQALRLAGELRAGQAVLINGAGGGVGTFAIQLAKRIGAEVTGVDAAHKLEAILDVGADHAVDYAQQDFAEMQQTYDQIVDCQAARSISTILRVLAPGGTYAMVGGQLWRVIPLLLRGALLKLMGDRRRLCVLAYGPNEGLADLARLLAAGQLVPVIGKTYTLADVPDALRYFGEGRHTGKIAIAISR